MVVLQRSVWGDLSKIVESVLIGELSEGYVYDLEVHV